MKIEKVTFLMELKVTFTKVTGKWFVKDKEEDSLKPPSHLA